jgi:hypothetical protein
VHLNPREYSRAIHSKACIVEPERSDTHSPTRQAWSNNQLTLGDGQILKFSYFYFRVVFSALYTVTLLLTMNSKADFISSLVESIPNVADIAEGNAADARAALTNLPLDQFQTLLRYLSPFLKKATLKKPRAIQSEHMLNLINSKFNIAGKPFQRAVVQVPSSRFMPKLVPPYVHPDLIASTQVITCIFESIVQASCCITFLGPGECRCERAGA